MQYGTTGAWNTPQMHNDGPHWCGSNLCVCTVLSILIAPCMLSLNGKYIMKNLLHILQICKRYASVLLPQRSFDNLYIQAGKFLTFLQMFLNSNPREIWCRSPPLQNLWRSPPLVPSSLSCRPLLGGTPLVELLGGTPWWNPLVERRWSGLCRLWSKPGLHKDWARWGEAAASTHLLQREFSTWAEQEIRTKITQQKNSSAHLCSTCTTSTLVSHISTPNQTICEHGRICEEYNVLESDCEMWKHVLWIFLS